MAKIKTCTYCKKEVSKLWYANPACCMSGECRKKALDERNNKKGISTRVLNKSPLKQKIRKPTGELKLFLEIYNARSAKCEITGEDLRFDVNCFAHILSKGAYPNFRLNAANIIMVKADIHHLYDNSSQEKLLDKYPGAKIIYQRKEILKTNYYK